MSDLMISRNVPPKYERIRHNAIWTKEHLDVPHFPTPIALYHYNNHLQNCINNPTVGFLARNQYITSNPYNYPQSFWINKKILERSPEIKVLKKQLEDLLKNTLYPKTMKIRKYIINHNRVVLDTTKQCQKYSKLEKLYLGIVKYL